MSIIIQNSASIETTPDYSSSFDCMGGNYLVACVVTSGTTAWNRPITGVTYNGISLTETMNESGVFYNNQPDNFVYVKWYTLSSPSSGSNTLTIDTSGDKTTKGITAYVFSLSSVVGVYGTNFSNTFLDIIPLSPTTALPIDQTLSGDSLAILIGSVFPNAVGANYHATGSGYTEYEDTQGLIGESGPGRYAVYKDYTDGIGTKTIDNGSNNFDLPGPGSPRTHFETAILLQGLGRASNFFPFFKK